MTHSTKPSTPLRRALRMETIGDGTAVFLGAQMPASDVDFRQGHDFFYMTGVEIPDAIFVVDGQRKESVVFFTMTESVADGFAIPVELVRAPVAYTGIERARPAEQFSGYLAGIARRDKPLCTLFICELTGKPRLFHLRSSGMADLTWAEVHGYLEASDRTLVSALSEGGSRPAMSPGQWTPTQVLAHLILTEQVMYPIWALVPRFRRVPALLRLVDQSNAVLWRAMGMRTVVEAGRLTPANAAEGRFRAPVFLRPGGAARSVDELLTRRRRVRERTLRAITSIEDRALNALRWSHPLMGALTLMEFAQFLGVHEQHHLPQILGRS
ncbi:MAG: aminopeptidase P N-terminal domain-containing protein [Vicinamibacteria bacterium]